MRTSASITAAMVVLFLAAGGCSENHTHLGLTDPSPTRSFVVVAAASAPTPVPIFLQFDDVNPCSGTVHTVTITGTAWIQDLDGRLVVREDRTVTTSSGFTGRGTDVFVDNGTTQKFTLNDMLTNESGARIRAHLVFVIDLSTIPPTARVSKGLDGPYCVGK
jgi:hypothetical protein